MLKIFERTFTVIGLFFVLWIIIAQGHELVLPLWGALLLAGYYIFEEAL